MTITHSDSAPPVGPRDTLAALIAELTDADRAHVLVLAPIVVDQPVCYFCDPTGPTGVVVATVALINRFGHLIRRTMCGRCVHEAVTWATSEGRGVTIRAALGGVR